MQTTLAGKAPLDVVILFVTKRAVFEAQLAKIRPRMAPACGTWGLRLVIRKALR